ncbi:MAG: Transcriptional regulatory protein QseF [Syntrophorhabdaceae bacterium PtaU1.Bin034]|nr:MAG: Transcriptional regulatory protein QseF [Syntrophorhabdaceae bacterium PtaU1.Bin034]
MKEMKTLIVDLDAGCETGITIQQILSSSSSRRIQVLRRSIQPDHSVTFEESLSATVLAYRPDAILLVVAPRSVLPARSAIRHISASPAKAPVIVVSENGGTGEIADLLSVGAADYITTPVRPTDLLPRIWRLVRQGAEPDTVTAGLKEKFGLQQIVGKNQAFLSEIHKIPMVAKCDAGVLITGETGTGKELCARAVHYLSPRSGYPFVAVNCGAIPPELMENELFGHVRGAFTGAYVSQQGLIREADGGTLFLDDIDTMPMHAQVKLLRFLQEKEYKQLGSPKTHRADLRVIAASNIDLENAVENGRFRRDLFYRLNVIPLNLPPLRERRDDIPTLAHHFLKKYAAEFGKNVGNFSAEAIAIMVRYHWSGNVRELENVVERAVIFSQDDVIKDIHIVLSKLANIQAASSGMSLKEAKARAIERFEKDYVEQVLRANHGNITKAAHAAQKNRRAFWELVRKHKIDVSEMRSNPL